MATFVIIHGAWGGGWEWRTVAEALAARGHRASTPTLSGLGPRSQTRPRDLGLKTHGEEVAQAIGAEETDVFLVAHSYGGMAATVGASLMPKRIRGLIYVDAFVPEDGQRETDLIDPAWVSSMLVEPARERGEGWLVPFPFLEDLDGFPRDVADRYRESWQPLATFTDPAVVDPAIRTLPTAFIHCTAKAPGQDAFVDIARVAQARGWLVVDIESGHDVQIERPDAVAAALDDLSTRM
jgi:pimeloyl-ACP methyl ester carboxylesterase